jgi:phosphopantetheinyl transferase
MPAPEVLLACARPADVPPQDWDELAALLDMEERDRARQFRFAADREAFVLAHALLRALVGAESGLAASEIRVVHDVKGRPFVERAPELHVSLTRSREAVACVATRAAPVGVDVEPIAGKPVDAGLLGAFVVTHEAVTARQFFFLWTALEAFWKALGTGLADGQPRICCVPRKGSRFDVHVARGSGGLRTDAGQCAGRGAIVDAFADCALAVVLRAPVEPQFVLKRTHCAGALDIRQLARARSPHEQSSAA